MTNNHPALTNRSLIRRTYIRTILITAVLSLFITLSVIAVLLIQSGTNTATKMTESLQDTFVHPTPNTDAWQATSQQGPSTTYVKIQYRNGNTNRQHTFYSKKAAAFTTRSSHQLTAGITSVNGSGWYFYKRHRTTRATYQVWIKADYALQQLYTVIIAVLLVVVLSASIGTFLIDLAAKRITQPLASLTKTANQRVQATDISAAPLPVPAEPLEAHQLAGSFNQLLRALNDQMTREKRFVADASHELRTPLAVIRGYISLLQRRGKQHPEVFDEALSFLDSESLRLQELVASLLTITRNEQAILTLEPVNLSDLLTTVVTSYQQQSPQPITTQLIPDLWINANPDSLKQVTLALLDNARKYAANATVTVKAQQIDQHIVMTVANTGPNIPDDAKPHLFDRFYRVDESRSSDIPGSGLGLAIVKQLVDQHHAQISVTDNVPTGAVFSITFNQLDPQFKNEEPSSNLH